MEREPERFSIKTVGQDNATDVGRLQPGLCVCIPLARSGGSSGNGECMGLLLGRSDASSTRTRGIRSCRGHAPGRCWGAVDAHDARSVLICGEEKCRKCCTRCGLWGGIWSEMDGRGRRGEWLLGNEWNARLAMAAPVRIQVVRRAVPSRLAATAPVVSRFAANSARMRNDRTREMRHGECKQRVGRTRTTNGGREL